MEKEVREERVLQGGSHGPAARCTAKTHHSANYDQAFPCRHSSAGNGKSLFSHTPIEAMGHGAMQMRSVYKHVHKHTNTGKACSLINTQRRSHSYTPCELTTRTHTITIRLSPNVGCQPIAHSLTQAPQKHLHSGNHTKKKHYQTEHFSKNASQHYNDTINFVCTY